MSKKKRKRWVSLFTREWIEILKRCTALRWVKRLPLYEGVDWNGRLLAKDRMQCSVSLFTREWIEMVLCKHFLNHSARSPSLRGSGLKYDFPVVFPALLYSLPLYEGVDWNGIVSGWLKNSFVSLFTREWIEIQNWRRYGLCRTVSLFTREWIEMIYPLISGDIAVLSPSLRGSGLKLQRNTPPCRNSCLPLYEGVDWNRQRT